MFCTNCGKEISEGSVFCPHCGQSQDKLQSHIVLTPQRARFDTTATLMCILLIINLLVMLLFPLISISMELTYEAPTIPMETFETGTASFHVLSGVSDQIHGSGKLHPTWRSCVSRMSSLSKVCFLACFAFPLAALLMRLTRSGKGSSTFAFLGLAFFIFYLLFSLSITYHDLSVSVDKEGFWLYYYSCHLHLLFGGIVCLICLLGIYILSCSPRVSTVAP